MPDRGTNQVSERPIAFSAAMVQAILAGRKTQTRRLITPQPPPAARAVDAPCRYGAAGERLWVRERFAYRRQLVDPSAPPTGTVLFAADPEATRYNGSRAWRPSHYLPRALSRVQLAITACRAERVKEITSSDAIAEGFDASTSRFADPIDWFGDLWDQLNFDTGFGWDANPWVWVITFQVAVQD